LLEKNGDHESSPHSALKFISVLKKPRTAIGIVCKDGVVMGVEKVITSKLYEPGVNRRLFIVDKHIGMVSKIFQRAYLIRFPQIFPD
jgi:20S proteasome alpha/beta subunit